MNIYFINFCKRFYSIQKPIIPKVCIVGGGPAGFYAAQHILKNNEAAHIDILERLPVPFGLVRFGVAPDHPEVKNVINTFTKTAKNPRIRFIGNINLGSALTLQHLKESYHAVLLSYGAEKDRNLDIPGEDLENVMSARSIVGWYNGVPWNTDLKVDLSGSTAVIIGHGNVGMDVARVLLTPVDLLKSTDITQHALESLMTSKIREVYMVGRRGPLQAAFTIKELREMLKLPNCHTKWTLQDFEGVAEAIPKLQRPKKRIVELMLASLKNNDSTNKTNYFIPKFLRSPLNFSGNGKVSKVTLGVNKLVGDDLISKSAVLTEAREEINCDLVIRSIGYKSTKADEHLPFDNSKGIVKNNTGEVEEGLYAAGWLATGPTGVILSTMGNSFEIANHICKYLAESNVLNTEKPGYERIRQIMKENNLRIVTWEGWERIDQHEQEMGKKVGKPREKILSIKEMLDIGGEYVTS